MKHSFPKPKPHYEKNRDQFKGTDTLRDAVISRVFTSTDSLPGNLHHIGINLINLYTSLPNIGHDNCLGPLTILMGINGADRDPEDPYEVKNCYQSWETCMACNMQLVFYRSKKHPDDILVKCLLNGAEASLPVPTDSYPYYKWSDFRQFYTARQATASLPQN